MESALRRFLGLLAGVSLATASWSATFGTVVPVRGTVSDIALDERRGRLYIANFSANRIEVMDTSRRVLLTPLLVPKPPSAVTLSPDNRYLVVGGYTPVGSNDGGYTVFDLDGGLRQDVVLPGGNVLAAAFGASPNAFLMTGSGVLALDPTTARTVEIPLSGASGEVLPRPLATFPADIIRASAGVSGDGTVIYFLAQTGGAAQSVSNLVARLDLSTGTLSAVGLTTSPPLGPRVVSVNANGSGVVAGWGRMDTNYTLLAQFPAAGGEFEIGAHAWDFARDRIYAQVPAPGDGAVLHVVDTDNLTVRERIQLPQNLAGRSVFSRDMRTLYAASVSGVTILPVGSLDSTPRLAALQEDVVFLGDACNRRVISQFVDIVDLAGGNVDFALSLPQNAAGIRLFPSSGTTPARVRVEVDPTVYQNARGTTAITLNLHSSQAVNLPTPVRLLINTRDFDQRGRFVNVPGSIVDILPDRFRNRIYMIRQDRNQVLVYDAQTLTLVRAMRTGNTPVHMAITADQRYLIVGNDNSQIASVFDLETLEPSAPIVFPGGHYPRSIGVAQNGIFATVRPASGPSTVDRIDILARVANTLPSLGIYENRLSSSEGVFAESPSQQTLFLALPDGNVLLYDSAAQTFVASRKDFPGLGGAYAALTSDLFLVGNHLLDSALVPVADLQVQSGTASGAAASGGTALRTTARNATGPGLIERLDLSNFQTFRGTSVIEAPKLATTLKSAPVGQIGNTILPFTRTLALTPDGSTVLALSESGITVLGPDFDAPTPIPAVAAVTNAADGGTNVAPGGLINISGSGLAPGSASADGVPLPSALGDICVSVNNVALPLFRVSPSEVMAQLPFTVAGSSTLTVRAPGGISNAFTFNIPDTAPAIFRSGKAGELSGLATVVRHKNNDLVTFTNPLHPNETISIYLTGLGRTTPEPEAGDAAPADPLAIARAVPVVRLGDSQLTLTYAGLVPGEVGVYQIDAFVPDGIREGREVPLVIQQGGSSTTLTVRIVSP